MVIAHARGLGRSAGNRVDLTESALPGHRGLRARDREIGQGKYAGRGIAFYGIYSDPDVTAESAANHASTHGLPMPILLDPDQRVARQVAARVTPEVFLAGV